MSTENNENISQFFDAEKPSDHHGDKQEMSKVGQGGT